MLTAALAIAQRGLPVFPCGPDKRPLTTHGFKDAATDPEQIRAWWTATPSALIGLPTGEPSGLVVLDVDMDPATGKDGEASLAALLAEQKAELPATRASKTPRGGRHIFFKHPGHKITSRTNWPAPCLDVRGDGGYVILPPSASEMGVYQWLVEVESVSLPAWLDALLSAPAVTAAPPRTTTTTNANSLPPSVESLLASGAGGGERNAKAIWLACQLRDCGRTQGEVESLLLAYGSRCSPPMASADEVRELQAAARSAFSRPPREPARNPARASNARFRPGSVAAEYLGTDEVPLELPEAPQWPAPMHPAAFHGLAGDVVRAIEPHTEADPAAVLVLLLAAFGNLAGASAHFLAEARRHPLRIWPVLVGETAKGRKGSAWSSLRHLLNRVDQGWVDACTTSGLSSGEGLIWRVRDPITKLKRNKDGSTETVVEDDGVQDKRLLCMEEEFSVVLKVSGREGNTISDLLRRAWDHGNLASLTKNSPARATGAHVTVAGHITTQELHRLLTETDALNGFGNRFLWLAVRRSKLLPEGGALATADLADLILLLRRALDFVRTANLFERTPAAREFWHNLYPVLTSDRAGLLGAITNRAEAYVMRMAVAYAALDLARAVDVRHMQAALAVWDYAERSAAFIFGTSMGDRVTDRILDALRAAGEQGMTQNAISEMFNRNESAAVLSAALGTLDRLQLAIRSTAPQERGRAPVVWRYPYERNELNERKGQGDGLNSYLSFLSLASTMGKQPQPALCPVPEAVFASPCLEEEVL
jgi:hypothetical protein